MTQSAAPSTTKYVIPLPMHVKFSAGLRWFMIIWEFLSFWKLGTLIEMTKNIKQAVYLNIFCDKMLQ